MAEVVKKKRASKSDELAASKYNEHVAAFVKRGRLIRGCRVWALVLFVALFGVTIGLPPIYQALVETKDSEGVQALHLFRDIFVTPGERANDLRIGVDSLSTQLATGKWADSSAVAWDNLSQATVQLWQRAQQINRHMELDSLHPRMAEWTHLRNLGNTPQDSLASMQQALQRLALRSEVHADLLSSVWRVGNSIVHETLFSSAYLRAWEKHIEESSRLANQTRPWMQLGMYHIFGSLGAKGVAGQDDWSFYRVGIDYATMPWVQKENPYDAIVEFRNQLKERGVELIVMPVPNKETIYPERLTSAASPDLAGMVGHGREALDSLRARGITVVDLYSAFRDERSHDKNLQDAIYLQNDTHWRLRGLKRAAQEVKQILAQQYWFKAPHENKEFRGHACMVDRTGDILAMTKLPIDFPTQKVECEQVYAMERDSTGAVIDSSLFRDDFRKARIFILGDSFSRIYQTDAPQSAGWISQLALQLQEPVASLVSDGGASTLVREKLARKPGVLRGKRVVIWEFVERDYRFGDSGWKTMHWND